LQSFCGHADGMTTSATVDIAFDLLHELGVGGRRVPADEVGAAYLFRKARNIDLGVV